MKLHEVQFRVKTFVEKHQIETSPEMRLLDLISEIGELSKEMLKANNYGKEVFQLSSDQHGKWTEELGDAFFSLICLANSTHVDLDNALHQVLNKYALRLQVKGDAGSGQ